MTGPWRSAEAVIDELENDRAESSPALKAAFGQPPNVPEPEAREAIVSDETQCPKAGCTRPAKHRGRHNGQTPAVRTRKPRDPKQNGQAPPLAVLIVEDGVARFTPQAIAALGVVVSVGGHKFRIDHYDGTSNEFRGELLTA